MRKPKESAARWREIVRGQANSGLSVAAYCRRARVPQSSFYAWRRKLRETPIFAEVRAAPERAPSGVTVTVPEPGALEVRLAGGRGIVVRPGFDRLTLLALIAALEPSDAAAAGDEADA